MSVFTGLYHSETLVDVTLAAEGKHLQAHKMLLSACSDYFQSLFSVNPCQHPIVILKDVRFEDLQTVVQFMYNGIVNVSSEKLPDILKVINIVIITTQVGRARKEQKKNQAILMENLSSRVQILSKKLFKQIGNISEHYIRVYFVQICCDFVLKIPKKGPKSPQNML